MTETYSTLPTDSDLDFGTDGEELLMTNQKLLSENDMLSKSLREIEHELKQKTCEFQIQIEKLQRSNENKNELITAYKTQLEGKPSSKSAYQQGELEAKLGDLENKLFLSEQSDQNTKRQNQLLNQEISNLKIAISKLSLNKRRTSSAMRSDADPIYGEISQERMAALIKENEELEGYRESMLTMLTEKEIENSDLRTLYENLQKTHCEEIARLTGQINDLTKELEDCDKRRRSSLGQGDTDERESLNSDEARALKELFNDLQTEYEEYKKETEERERMQVHDKEMLMTKFHSVELLYQEKIAELEEEKRLIKGKLTNFEIESAQWEKEKERYLYPMTDELEEMNYRNLYLAEIEQLQTRLQNLKDEKEKNEAAIKQHLEQQMKDIEQNFFAARDARYELEKELSQLKLNFTKTSKEQNEKLLSKDKEINQLKEKLEKLEKEKENLQKLFDTAKKSNEKTINEYKDLNETLKKIKEKEENEIKKWEERYILLEKIFESEKSGLIAQNRELLIKYRDIKTQLDIKIKGMSQERTYEASLDEIFNENRTTNGHNGQELLLLSEEIKMHKSKIVELNFKIASMEKDKQELEILKLENEKLKSDLKETTEMYETQINELQQKAIQISTELHSSRKRAATIRSEISSLSPKQQEALSDLESTISKLTAENKFLSQNCEDLNREIELVKQLREKDSQYFKEELKIADQQAVTAKVQVATVAFEKDSEIIKCKNLIKKLKSKLQSLGIVSQSKVIQNQKGTSKGK